MRTMFLSLAAVLLGVTSASADELAGWKSGVRIRPVLPDAERHSIHAYFNTSPESPDGKRVLLYTSTTPDGHEGEVWMVERASGKVTTLARGVSTEDAHRAACQQWVSGGRAVVFHDHRDGHWVVVCVDTETLKERVLAQDRQVCWGQPNAEVVPVYSPHATPGAFRDLELIDVRTGEVRTITRADAVRKAYPEWVSRRFGDRQISLFFPILSPDLSKVIFKVATPAGGDFRSKQASDRDGLVCCDVATGRVLWMQEKWGHPAWHPDSHSLINYGSKGLYELDAETGRVRPAAKLPLFPGSHPSFGRGGMLFATDLQAAEAGVWGVAVGSLTGGEHQVLHRFDNSRGSTSWRRSHPHPSFSSDGRRLYFNVSADRWTRLFVAERSDPAQAREPAPGN